VAAFTLALANGEDLDAALAAACAAPAGLAGGAGR
jgi:hypothetical protein